MRTIDCLTRALSEVEEYVHLHGDSVWLIPVGQGYQISPVKPSPEDLPNRSRAIKYGMSNGYFKSLEYVLWKRT